MARLLRAARGRVRARLSSSPSARPTCAQHRSLAGRRPSPAAACSRSPAAPAGGRRIGARDAARLAGHRPQPRDAGAGARQGRCRRACSSPRSDAYTLAGLGDAAASTPPSPAAGGAMCRWRGCRRGWRRCTRGCSPARAWSCSTTASCDDQQHADLAPRRRRQQLPAAPLDDGSGARGAEELPARRDEAIAAARRRARATRMDRPRSHYWTAERTRPDA